MSCCLGLLDAVKVAVAPDRLRVQRIVHGRHGQRTKGLRSVNRSMLSHVRRSIL